MKKLTTKLNYTIECYELPDGKLEVRYFETIKDSSYLAWILPKKVVDTLIAWWKRCGKNNVLQFPITKKTKVCEITMYSNNSIHLREVDNLGRYKLVGWDLPKIVVDEIADRYKGKGKKK
jgi:hypothetical protein